MNKSSVGKGSSDAFGRAMYIAFIVTFVLDGISMLSSASSTGTVFLLQSTSGTVNTILCQIISTISTILAMLALAMFILGAVLYAGGHFLPAAGNLKGGLQGWGMGMLIGGVVAIILYLLAPFIISRLMSLSGGGILGSAVPKLSVATCSGGIGTI